VTDSDEFVVLCVDPAPKSRADTVGTFEDRAGFQVHAAGTVEGGLGLAATHDVDCVVAEYRLPDGTGFDCFEGVREQNPNAVCVLFTEAGHGDIDSSAFRDVVAEYLRKGGPDAHDRLVDLVHNAVVNRTQAGFPLPSDEDDRLEAVAEYDIGDLETIETFDRLSALIASHFGVNVAFVGLVDEEEERFLACHGADWDRLAREDTVCTYAILDEDVTVVEDVQADPRFEHNETFRELSVCSYAGANITGDGGEVIGELCLIDGQPRSYTDTEIEDLKLFAEEVSEQLCLRRRLREAEEVTE